MPVSESQILRKLAERLKLSKGWMSLHVTVSETSGYRPSLGVELWLVPALEVSKLAKDLRALVDSAERRLWIACPYIGSWRAVKRILGSAWQKVDVMLLLDKESGVLARDTVEKFAAHRPVRSLKGLHAKLYIVDDSVLLTSANLTECAFTRRYESGLVLTGAHARELISFYEGLWEDRAKEVDVSEISFSRPSKRGVDEGRHGAKLPKLFDLPSDPSPPPTGFGAFADYRDFLDVYRRFADAYVACGGRDRPEQSLYLETDKFLNFLFNADESHPSREYRKSKQPRVLTDSGRGAEIRKYRERYRRAGLPGGDHSATAKKVQDYLAQAKVMQLTSEEVKIVAGSLNCFGNHLALSRFLNGNDLAAIRTQWRDLVHGSGDVKLRMNRCHSALFGFGKAAIQETLGYSHPDRFPLRNENTNAGLRFLGYRA